MNASLITAVAVGGALGAVGRYAVSDAVHTFLGREFPFGTLAVNALGSLLIGICYVLMAERALVGPELRAALTVGLLGAFTTFSTFSLETLQLMEGGNYLPAMLNILLSVIVCLGLCAVGMILARQL